MKLDVMEKLRQLAAGERLSKHQLILLGEAVGEMMKGLADIQTVTSRAVDPVRVSWINRTAKGFLTRFGAQ